MLVDARRFADARAMLHVVLASDPDQAEAWCLLSLACDGMGDHQAALQAANRAVAIAPDGEHGHRLASIALVALDRPLEALPAAREARRLAPELWQTHAQLAFTAAARAQDMGRVFKTLNPPRRRALREGRASAKRSVEIAPHEADTHFAVGFVAHMASRHRAARAAYRRALALNPNHPGVHNNSALLSLGRGGLRSAARSLRSALREDPHSPEARENLEHLGMRAIWLGWLVVTAADAGLLGMSYVGPAALRVGLGLLLVAALFFTARRFLREVPHDVQRYVAGRLRQRWQTWVFGPLLLAAAVTCLCLTVLPTSVAQAVGIAYLGLWVTVARVLGLVFVVGAVVSAFGRRK